MSPRSNFIRTDVRWSIHRLFYNISQYPVNTHKPSRTLTRNCPALCPGSFWEYPGTSSRSNSIRTDVGWSIHRLFYNILQYPVNIHTTFRNASQKLSSTLSGNVIQTKVLEDIGANVGWPMNLGRIWPIGRRRSAHE